VINSSQMGAKVSFKRVCMLVKIVYQYNSYKSVFLVSCSFVLYCQVGTDAMCVATIFHKNVTTSFNSIVETVWITYL